jgi:hypothetical protein
VWSSETVASKFHEGSNRESAHAGISSVEQLKGGHHTYAYNPVTKTPFIRVTDDHGVDVSEVFHEAIGAFHHAGVEARAGGPVPDHNSYGSFVSFADPDGNTWFFQESTAPLPGR